ELDRRLERAGVAEPERAEAVAKLVGAGYVDDGRFAEGRAALLAERGLGDEAIRRDLEGRGIDAELVRRALHGLELVRDRARRVAERAGGGVRAARALAR